MHASRALRGRFEMKYMPTPTAVASAGAEANEAAALTPSLSSAVKDESSVQSKSVKTLFLKVVTVVNDVPKVQHQ